MVIILDANILHKFFDILHEDHRHYKPVYKCLFEKKGKIVLGGTTLKKELLERNKKFLPVFAELSRAGKILRLIDEEVDDLEKKLKDIEKSKDFDDPHIIACIILSKTEVLVSDDSRADRFIKDKRFYPKKFIIPSIYRLYSHRHLMDSCS